MNALTGSPIASSKCLVFLGLLELLGWSSGNTQGFHVRTLGRRPFVIGLKQQNHIRSIAFAPVGYTLASTDEKGFIKIWDARTRRLGPTIRTPASDDNPSPGDQQYLAFSRDGTTLAVGCSDRKLRVWDLATKTARVFLERHDESFRAIAYSPDGLTLASGDDSGMVRLWDINSGASRLAYSAHTGGVETLAFSPGGQTLASGGRDNVARIWDAGTGALRSELRGHSGAGVSCVRFHRDGRILATGGLDNTARIWDISTSREQKCLIPDCEECVIYAVAFSPVAEVSATTGACGVITLWNHESGQRLRSLRLRNEFLECLEFSSDGKFLAASSGDELIYVIGIPSQLMRRPGKRDGATGGANLTDIVVARPSARS
jgi:WD40 repeat protein